MLYGFVVAAFLIIHVDAGSTKVPFATMAACLEAEAMWREVYGKRGHIACVKTGVRDRRY